MGVKGLLQIVKTKDNNISLNDLSGQRCAIDMSIWLHRALFCCPVDDKQRTKKYLKLIDKLLNLFLKAGITLMAVFDGKNAFPLKWKVNAQRQDMKQQNLTKAKQCSSKQKIKYEQRAASIDQRMINSVKFLLQQKNIQYIDAPYEADAQIGSLYQHKKIDFAVTEDSDLLLFGCPKIFTKLKTNGQGNFISIVKNETQIENVTDKHGQLFVNFNPMQQLEASILAGCDYLSSIPKIGLKTSIKLMQQHKNFENVYKNLMQSEKYTVPADYEQNFEKAKIGFLHQYVFVETENNNWKCESLNSSSLSQSTLKDAIGEPISWSPHPQLESQDVDILEHDIAKEQDEEQEKDFEKMLDMDEDNKVHSAHRKNLNVSKVETIARHYNSDTHQIRYSTIRCSLMPYTTSSS